MICCDDFVREESPCVISISVVFTRSKIWRGDGRQDPKADFGLTNRLTLGVGG